MKIFILTDTFNTRDVSRHHSLKAAVLARAKFGRAVKRCNGPNSYIPTCIDLLVDGERSEVDRDAVWQAEHEAGII